MDPRHRAAEILLEIKAVRFNAKNLYAWSSGLVAPTYCDNRMIISFVDRRREITGMISEMVEEKIGLDSFEKVCRVSTAGIPHAGWVAEKLDKPLLYARKKPKMYGKKNIVEGVLNSGDNVLMVEDIVSTGRSSLRSVEAIRMMGGKCSECVAIVNYDLGPQEKNFARANCRLFALTDFSAIIEAAIEKEYFSEEELEAVFEWKSNPLRRSRERCLA